MPVPRRCALERANGPTALLLSRQNVAFQPRSTRDGIAQGGYVLSDAPAPRAVLIATGSEVPVAMAAQKLLAGEGVAVRVVSMPSTTVFDRQPDDYKKAVLLEKLPRVAIEAGVSDFWRKYVGLEGAVLGIDRFGESAPAPELFRHFGFTAEKLVEAVKKVL